MATQISIIDVNIDINSIITEEITTLTDQTKDILAEYRETQLAEAKLKQRVDEIAEASKAKLLQTIQRLIDAGPDGIPVSELYIFVTPEINTITLTTKIKNQLKATGNEWALTKKKAQKIDRYVLVPYNHEDL